MCFIIDVTWCDCYLCFNDVFFSVMDFVLMSSILLFYEFIIIDFYLKYLDF